MKRLKLAVAALFTLVTIVSVSAQDSNNPWVVGFGLNLVDIRTSSDFSTNVEDYLGPNDWNLLPSISRISVEKYIEDGWEIAAINYPRAKTDPELIEEFMEILAEDLLVTFQQKRITLVTPRISIMYESEASYMPQYIDPVK